MIIRDDQTVWFDNNILDLQQTWQQTSHQIQHLRDNPECADSEFALLADNTKSALFADLTFDLKEDLAAPFINRGAQPKNRRIARARRERAGGKWPPPLPAPVLMPTTCTCPT